MPEVHPTAVVTGDVELADDVSIGPGCVLTGPVRIGDGTRIVGNAYLQGPIEIGRRNIVYPFGCLGFAPQHAKFDAATPGRGIVIGDDNTFREYVSVHRAFEDDGPTRVGSGNMLMTGAHLGHDVHLGDDCTIVTGAAVGGHVTISDGVIIGGLGVVHQFVRIGRGAMFQGLTGTNLDVPPWFLVTHHNVCGAVNLVGLRRSGMPRDQIDEVRWVFRVLYRKGYAPKTALAKLRERKNSAVVAEYIEFIESSDRGICHGRGQGARGK